MKFFASGIPRPKGNHIALCPRRREHHHGHSTPCRPFVTEDTRSDQGKKVAAWETAVRVASRSVAPPIPLEGPVSVRYTFRIPQPAARKKEPAPTFSRADVDKLLRAVNDALQAQCDGYLVKDDKQIVAGSFVVLWADERGPGVEVEVTPLGPEQQTLFGARA